MIFAVETLAERERENLLNDAVGLRPPAWVSALDRAGHLYLAPFPFLTAVCIDPMTVLFCVNNAEDTPENLVLRAIASTGEFVINFPSEETIAALNTTALPAQLEQGVVNWAADTIPSATVRTPRLATVPLAFACRLHQVMKMGIGPGGTSVIFGDVKSIYRQKSAGDE